MSVDIYALNLLIEHSGEHRLGQNVFCLFTTPQAFWQSSALGALSTLVISVVLYSLTLATLMSPGKDEIHVCGYIYIYIYQCHINAVWETSILGWAPKLWNPNNTFQVFFSQLCFNKKYVKVAVSDFTKHLIILKWLRIQKCRQKRKTMRQRGRN